MDQKAGTAAASLPRRGRTPLNRQQIIGFWAAWAGWLLDGMDSVIYALVLAPALIELLPRSGMEATPANVGFVGSVMFALFLVGWGLSFIWGPIADRFGRTKSLAATIPGLCRLHRPCRRGAGRLATRAVPLPGRRRRRWRMGHWPAPMSPNPGRRTAARWARAICRPAIISASSWLRRSISRSAPLTVGAPCSCAASPPSPSR